VPVFHSAAASFFLPIFSIINQKTAMCQFGVVIEPSFC
jgi:hypothetical protein